MPFKTTTAALFLSALLVGCADKTTPTDDTGAAGGGSGDGADAAAGEALYSSNCASCHGADGTGNSGAAADLTAEVPEMSVEGLVDVILNGSGSMPPVGVSEDEAEDIAAYVRATFGG